MKKKLYFNVNVWLRSVRVIVSSYDVSAFFENLEMFIVREVSGEMVDFVGDCRECSLLIQELLMTEMKHRLLSFSNGLGLFEISFDSFADLHIPFDLLHELIDGLLLSVDDLILVIVITLEFLVGAFHGMNASLSCFELTLVELKHAELEVLDDECLVLVVVSLALVVDWSHLGSWKQIGK